MRNIQDIRQQNLQQLSGAYASQRLFADALDATPGYINQLLNGHRAIGEKAARKIEGQLGLKHLALDEDNEPLEGEYLPAQPDVKTEPPIIESNAEFIGGFEEWDNDTPLRDDEVELPFFKEVELSAGSGKYHIEENYGGKLRFSKQALKSHGVAIHAAACVKVSGNSMEPVFPDGCTVGIDTANTAIKDGEIYAINYNGRLLIKATYRVPTGGLRLKSFNTEEWPDEPVTEDKMELLKILGRVFWCSWLR